MSLSPGHCVSMESVSNLYIQCQYLEQNVRITLPQAFTSTVYQTYKNQSASMNVEKKKDLAVCWYPTKYRWFRKNLVLDNWPNDETDLPIWKILLIQISFALLVADVPGGKKRRMFLLHILRTKNSLL